MANILTKLFTRSFVDLPDLVEDVPAKQRSECYQQATGQDSATTTGQSPATVASESNRRADFGKTYSRVQTGTDSNGEPIYKFFLIENNTPSTAPTQNYRTICTTHTIPGYTRTTPRNPVEIKTPDIGWNGSALSDAFIIKNGEATFSVSDTTVGAVVGLNTWDGRTSSGYFDIGFGFLLTRGVASVIENNVSRQPLGKFTKSDSFTVRRAEGVIFYFKNQDLVYTSELEGGDDVLYLDASLYLSGDSVLDAKINLDVIAEVFAPLTVLSSATSLVAGWVRIDDSVFVPQIKMQSFSRLVEIRKNILGVERIASVSSLSDIESLLNTSVNSFPALTGIGSDKATGQAYGAFQPLESYALGNALSINIAYSTSVLPALTGHSTVLTGGNNYDSPVSFLPLRGHCSDHPYTESVNQFIALYAVAGLFPAMRVGAARLYDRAGSNQGSSILLWTGRHLLTAAHVVDEYTDLNRVDIDFITDDGVTLPTYRAYRVTVHPDWNPKRGADGKVTDFDNDLAIIELTRYVDPIVRRHYLYTKEDELGQVFEKTSYSPRIHPETGAVSPSGWDVINNQFDRIEPGFLLFDFDNGKTINDVFSSTGAQVVNEGFVSPGDSGGAALIDNKIAGISSYAYGFKNLPDVSPGTNFTYGEVAADIRVSAYDNWITANSNVTSPLYSVDPAIPEIKVQLRPVFSTVDIVLPALEINAAASRTTLNITEVVLPSLAIEAYSGAFVELALPLFEIEAQASHSVLATVDIALPRLAIAATGFNGALANIDITLPLSLEIEAFGASQVNIVLPALVIDAQAVTSTRATFDIVLPGLAIEATADTTRADVMAVIDITLPGLEFIYGAIDIVLPQLVIDAGQPVYSDAALRDDTGVAYAFNVLHGETTRYTQYDFNQIVRLNGLYYGIKAEGIYLLEGEKDGLENIAAKFKTADMDFGSTLHKRVPYVYLDTTDKTQITPFTDDRPNCTYPSNFNGRRTRLARGPKGRFWAFEVSNVNGLPLDLRSLEFYPTILSRKV